MQEMLVAASPPTPGAIPIPEDGTLPVPQPTPEDGLGLRLKATLRAVGVAPVRRHKATLLVGAGPPRRTSGATRVVQRLDSGPVSQIPGVSRQRAQARLRRGGRARLAQSSGEGPKALGTRGRSSQRRAQPSLPEAADIEGHLMLRPGRPLPAPWAHWTRHGMLPTKLAADSMTGRGAMRTRHGTRPKAPGARSRTGPVAMLTMPRAPLTIHVAVRERRPTRRLPKPAGSKRAPAAPSTAHVGRRVTLLILPLRRPADSRTRPAGA